MPNLAMRQPGTLFVGDGLDLSWPIGGDREVVAVAEADMTLRIRRRIAEGQIAIVDDKPTKKTGGDAREYKLLTGEEARKVFEEPAGPVTRVIYEPVAFEEHVVEAAVFEPLSERAQKAAEEAAKAAEEDSQAVAKRQVAAEKAAAKEAAEAEEPEPDPLAERLRRTDEITEAAALEAEKEFMERETARQKLEAEAQKAAEAKAKAEAEEAEEAEAEEAEPEESPEPEAPKAKAEAPKAEAKAEAPKAAAAKEKASADTQAALSESTPVKAPKPGETPKSKGGQPK